MASSSPAKRLQKGIWFMQAGLYDQALQCFRYVIFKAPGTPIAQQAENAIKQIEGAGLNQNLGG